MTEPSLSISRESTSLRHQVTASLRKAILSGHFSPGDRLLERELCEQLDISRSLVREALQHLQAEGLITIVPHKGPMVARIDADEAREIYAVRQNLEGLAGEGFARQASAAQIAELRKALAHLATPEASSNTEVLLEAKNRFYSILLAGCGNRVVGQLLVQLNNRVTMLRRMSLSQPGRLPQTLAELEAIVCAIETRDTPLARELCTAHVARAAEIVLSSFLRSSTMPVDLTPADLMPVDPVPVKANPIGLNSTETKRASRPRREIGHLK